MHALRAAAEGESDREGGLRQKTEQRQRERERSGQCRERQSCLGLVMLKTT